MIYDMRTYTPHPGKGPAMRERFLTQVVPIFARLGIQLVDAYQVQGSEDLCYLTRFPDLDARERAWNAFKDDPEWAAKKAASETDGPLLAGQKVTVLTKIA